VIVRFLAIVAVLASQSCWAGVTEIKQFFETALASNDVAPAQKEFFNTVNENTVLPLPAADISAILTLASRALHSPNPEVRSYGLLFFMAVALRLDSSALVEPYVDELGAIANGPSGGQQSPRLGALFILGSTHPNVLPKAIPYLLKNLEAASSSPQETLSAAASLLEAFPKDPPIIGRVLGITSDRSDSGLTTGVVRQLGLMKTVEPQALKFIGSALDSPNPTVRFAAAEAVGKLDRDVRARFARQLGRIASDRDESEDLRRMASAALVQ